MAAHLRASAYLGLPSFLHALLTKAREMGTPLAFEAAFVIDDTEVSAGDIEDRVEVLEVQSDVQSAFEQVRESQRTVALYSQKLVPIAEQNVAVARNNYIAGRGDFLRLAASLDW